MCQSNRTFNTVDAYVCKIQNVQSKENTMLSMDLFLSIWTKKLNLNVSFAVKFYAMIVRELRNENNSLKTFIDIPQQSTLRQGQNIF